MNGNKGPDNLSAGTNNHDKVADNHVKGADNHDKGTNNHDKDAENHVKGADNNTIRVPILEISAPIGCGTWARAFPFPLAAPSVYTVPITKWTALAAEHDRLAALQHEVEQQYAERQARRTTVPCEYPVSTP